MENLLFDTSVWVDLLRGKQNPKSLLLKYYLENDEPVFICPPVFQEILQGIKNENSFSGIANKLSDLNLLTIDSYDAAKEAALIYQNCRTKGVTIRKSHDCLIAYYAILFSIKIVHNDPDFDLIASQTTLKIYQI